MIDPSVRPAIVTLKGRISIQADHNCYCTPREDNGPYQALEVAVFGPLANELPEEFKQYEEEEAFSTPGRLFCYLPVPVLEEWLATMGLGIPEWVSQDF